MLLLSACAAGLTGLSLPGSSSATAHPSDTAAVSGTFSAEATVLPVTSLFPRVTEGATRSRALPAKTKVAPKKARHLGGGWVRPSYAGIVSPYGMRWGRMHEGIDFGASFGTPIHAIGDGVVVGAGYLADEGGYGQLTLIRHAGGIVSAYAHQSRMIVRAGDRVTAGEVIGYVGATGHVTGPHLHFEIRMSTHGGQVNPSTWLRQHGVDV